MQISHLFCSKFHQFRSFLLFFTFFSSKFLSFIKILILGFRLIPGLIFNSNKKIAEDTNIKENTALFLWPVPRINFVQPIWEKFQDIIIHQPGNLVEVCDKKSPFRGRQGVLIQAHRETTQMTVAFPLLPQTVQFKLDQLEQVAISTVMLVLCHGRSQFESEGDAPNEVRTNTYEPKSNQIDVIMFYESGAITISYTSCTRVHPFLGIQKSKDAEPLLPCPRKG